MITIRLGEGKIGISGQSVEDEYFLYFDKLNEEKEIGTQVDAADIDRPLVKICFAGEKDIAVLQGILTRMLNHARSTETWQVVGEAR